MPEPYKLSVTEAAEPGHVQSRPYMVRAGRPRSFLSLLGHMNMKMA
jgi:hypothetical protein